MPRDFSVGNILSLYFVGVAELTSNTPTGASLSTTSSPLVALTQKSRNAPKRPHVSLQQDGILQQQNEKLEVKVAKL